MTLDLQKICKDNTDISCVSFTRFPNVNHSHNQGAFVTTKTSTLLCYYQPSSAVYSDFTSFSTAGPLQFQDPIQDTTLHLLHFLCVIPDS